MKIICGWYLKGLYFQFDPFSFWYRYHSGIAIMREMSRMECLFHEDEEQEQKAKAQQQEQPISGPRLQHPTRCPIVPPQKRPRDRFRTVDPSPGVVPDGCAVGGQAADLGFSGGIGTMQGPIIISDSGQQVYASLPGNFVMLCTGHGY